MRDRWKQYNVTMLHFYSGTDRGKKSEALQKDIARVKEVEIVRVTDAHTLEDFNVSLQGGGMFGATRAVVFENVLQHEDMAGVLLEKLEALKESTEHFFILEEKVDAATRKKVEKYAEKSERFDAGKSERDSSIFELANALQRRDKKKLWVGYMREIAKGSAPEMVHGVLFWAAKQQLLRSQTDAARSHAAHVVGDLAELPHLARRSGFDMEYALERFVLSVA